ELRDTVRAHRRFIEGYAARTTLAGLLDAVEAEIARRFAAGFLDLGLDEDTPERFDPGFIDRLLGVIAHGVDGTAAGGSPWRQVFAAGDVGGSDYFTSAVQQPMF